MIVYHGSTLDIPYPDVNHSKQYLDFGQGFYVTTFQKQAEKWAVRKSIRKRTEAIVNVYELKEDFSKFRVLRFKDTDEEWLDFVCSCRNGEHIYRDYDIIIGNVADDDVFKSIGMYIDGLWDKQRTIQELRFYKKNDQIVIVSQKALNHNLIYQRSYKVVR